MGFHTGAFAKVWGVTPISNTCTKLRISVSRKNKETDEFEDDFSGFVLAVGTAAAARASKLREGDRIKLGDVDVSTKYDRDSKVSYTNFKLFSFEDADSAGRSAPRAQARTRKPAEDDGGDYDDTVRDLPF